MDSKGVLVAEVLTDATSVEDLQSWYGARFDYLLFHVDPMWQFMDDYGSDLVAFPTLPIIDLQTMKVVKKNCFSEDWVACVSEFLE